MLDFIVPLVTFVLGLVFGWFGGIQALIDKYPHSLGLDVGQWLKGK